MTYAVVIKLPVLPDDILEDLHVVLDKRSGDLLTKTEYGSLLRMQTIRRPALEEIGEVLKDEWAHMRFVAVSSVDAETKRLLELEMSILEDAINGIKRCLNMPPAQKANPPGLRS